MDKICKTCRYHEHEDISDGYVCVNDESEMCADWTEDDYSCEHWEMYDCCQNCKYLRDLWWWKDYPKDKQCGHCCVALEPEGVVMQLYGTCDSADLCEMHRRKDERTNEHI